MSQSPSSRSIAKASKRRSQATPSQSKSTKPASRRDLVDQLVQAREEHVRDLRILLDKSAEREQQLADMVRMVMEERFYRPVVTRDNERPRQQPSILPLESLSDVSTFDSESDRKRIDAQEQIGREIESEFATILNEHNRSHEEQPVKDAPA